MIIKTLHKILIAVLFLNISSLLFSQNIGINTSGTSPSINAILDLNSGNQFNMGLIIPHVTLGASLTTFSPPIVNGATTKDTGMIVYNINGIQPVGYYYWNGTTWTSVSGAANDWQILGNSNIADGTSFLGTTNTVPINFKINGNRAGRVDAVNFNTYFGYLTTAVNTGLNSTGIGAYASYSTSTPIGNNLTTLGYYAGYNSLSGNSTVIGDSAGSSYCLCDDAYTGNNVFIGYGAGSDAFCDVAIGWMTISSGGNSGDATAVGSAALPFSSLSNIFNTGIGAQAISGTSESEVTASGYKALGDSGSRGTDGVANGALSMRFTTGGSNTAIGALAMEYTTNGASNNAIGVTALYKNASNSVAIGDSALYCPSSLSSGTQNIAIGNSALFNNTASNNTAIGQQVMYNNTTGSKNTATGYAVLYANTSGLHNTANGMSSLYSNTTASSNTALGYEAGYNNNGSQNVFIGDSAGAANTSGTNNIFVGYKANANAGTYTNVTAIGNSAIVTASNSVQIGNSNVVFCGINGAPFNAAYALSVGTGGSNGNGAYCSIGGAWNNASDRKKKENFSIPDGKDILTKVCALSIFRWNYKNEPANVQHIGPMAQDFYRIFQVGNDSLSISTIDPAGIELVAIKELNKKLETQIQSLKEKQMQHKKELEALEKIVDSMMQLQASVK